MTPQFTVLDLVALAIASFTVGGFFVASTYQGIREGSKRVKADLERIVPIVHAARSVAELRASIEHAAGREIIPLRELEIKLAWYDVVLKMQLRPPRPWPDPPDMPATTGGAA